MKRSRREFLGQIGAIGAIPIVGCADADPELLPLEPDAAQVSEPIPNYEYDGELGPDTLFSHGVASGDPLVNAVIIWTRVTPETADTPVEVWWEMAADAAFEDRLGAGTIEATADTDWTVKLDMGELEPGTDYWYRFFALGVESATGKTRTAPQGEVDRVRLAVMSCSNITRGWFHAYESAATQPDIDAVLHLGDYFYESGASGFVAERDHQPAHELVSLEDYRTRYAQYRTDPDLQALHAAHPFIPVWDDHESANNSWKDGAENHQPDSEGDWATRKAAAQRAWDEWMPTRTEAPDRIWRALAFGNLVDLYMLDTRLFGRDKQSKDPDEMAAPDRSLLGEAQEAWIAEELAASTATWRVLGQQVVMAPVQAGGEAINPDMWDGYQGARDRLIKAIDGAAGDTVVLTGDIHSSWAADVPRDMGAYDPVTGEGSAAVEFVTPGVTSGFPLDPNLIEMAKQLNPHIAYGEVAHKGYMVIDIDAERVEATWHHWADVTDADAPVTPGGVFRTALGSRHVTGEE